MLRAAGKMTRIAVPLLILTLAALEPALADRPWQDPDDKPGNGKSKRWHGNNAPTIEGTPASVAQVDELYAFQPVATDKDGDTLSFSIVNKPSWAAFDTGNGYLSGYPSAADAGTETQDIVISVSDGRDTASLSPFSVMVSQPTVNSPPVISGTPPPEVLAGQPYSFTPTATDPEGDTLDFSIANPPPWTSFDTSNGKLHGTPEAGDVGPYENILISVSDGTSSASIPAFSITVVQTTTGSVTLSWTAPTLNTDGTPLLDLARFTVYYGTAARQYDYSIVIDNTGVTTAVIGDLSPETWYFAVTATNTSGAESDLSAEAVQVVQ